MATVNIFLSANILRARGMIINTSSSWARAMQRIHHDVVYVRAEEFHTRNICLETVRISEDAPQILSRRTCHESDQVSKAFDVASRGLFIYLRYPLSRLYMLWTSAMQIICWSVYALGCRSVSIQTAREFLRVFILGFSQHIDTCHTKYGS